MADPSSSAASKDNANPVIHSQATETVRRDHTLGGYADDQEWWRDSGMKLASSSSGLHDGSQHELQDWFNDAAAAGNDDDEVKKLLKDTMDIDGDKQAPALVDGREEIDQQEIFDLVRSITDPEHPLTLEQLAVVNPQHITITPSPSTPHILLEFTPTIPHCSMSTLIGLSLRVRLLRSLSPKYKVDIRVRPGTHQSEDSVNKQLNDKERVAAALENQHLLEVVMQTLSSAYKRGGSRTAAAVGPGIEGKSNSSALAGNDMEMMEEDAQKDSALEQAEMLARLLGVTV